MNKDFLQNIAKKLVEKKKGILAADESISTAGKRLAEIGTPSTEETRRQYRELFFGTPNIEDYISGVILYDETMRQLSNNGMTFPKFLESKGILPGIKVDEGVFDFPGFPNEKITRGLDKLADKLPEYKSMGAVFTKWRSVIGISEQIPTRACVETNVIDMARYARIVQDEELVPIVEPEVLLSGKHSIDRCEDVLKETLKILFEKLVVYKVFLPGLILKTSMVLPGSESGEIVSATEVAKRTVSVLKKVVPKEIAGIVFLSGGQGPEDATKHLNSIAKLEPLPWEIAFSYARALQTEPMNVWQGKAENVGKARDVFIERLKKTVAADQGRYF